QGGLYFIWQSNLKRPAEWPAGHGRSLLAHPNSRGSSGTRERTLVAGKPEGVQRWLMGNGIHRFGGASSCSGRRAAVVWEGPNAVCSSRAMTGHTDSAEAGPSTVGAHQNPRRQEHRPRLRLHGGGSGEIQLRFQNSELVHWADETHQGSIHPAWALRLPLAPAATQDQLPLSTRT
uniref:Uncharacterized protein n=1 Tax=Ursus americanus TaxID=9643 RepID=A0A452SSK1_URSAM